MNSRDISLDFVKGILIWLVVLGHSIQNIIYHDSEMFWTDPVFQVIYIFHMPLFIGLSGYFFDPIKVRAQPLGGFVLQRGSQILLPMLTWVILGTGAWVAVKILAGNANPVAFTKFFLSSLFSSYWFLWCVFLSCFAMALIVKSRFNQLVSIVFLSVILLLAPVEDLPLIGYSAFMFAFMFPFFAAGMLLRNFCSERLRSASPFIMALSAVIFILSYLLWRPEAYAYVNHMNIIEYPAMVPLTFLGGAAGSLLVVACLRRFYLIVEDSRFAAWFVRLGRITLPLYLAQDFVFRIVKNFIWTDLVHYPYFLALAFCLAFSLALIWCLKYMVDATSSSPQLMRRMVWGIS